MTRNRYEKQVSFIRIFSPKPTLSNILKKVALTCILSSKLPRRLIKRLRIAIRIYVHLKPLQHLSIIQPKHIRCMIHIRKFSILLFTDQIRSQIHCLYCCCCYCW
ncbi:hypothetical protein HanXRQr2_Chr14g0646381 [Helianthus annuus]|uniref:Uncharacterized protein n=1 Tax=Helianthus annuus TaxID=4232 RepID=A0A9K3EA04_HELAN|nr:hypothetical protein HanXRQr2_Chr14g0646381 [Helianthus annuus]